MFKDIPIEIDGDLFYDLEFAESLAHLLEFGIDLNHEQYLEVIQYRISTS